MNQTKLEEIYNILDQKHPSGANAIHIGACDGIIDDEFYSFFQARDWKLLLVEPRKVYFERLKNNYKNKKNISFENAAITVHDGPFSLYTYPSDGVFSSWQEGCATLIPAQHEVLSKCAELETETISGLTFNSLMNKHVLSSFDFLIVDVEGFEWEILEQINLREFKKPCLYIEVKHGDKKEKIHEKINSHGYSVLTYKENIFCY